MNEKERNQKEWEDRKNWKGPWGRLFYSSERDTRVWVPKRRPTMGWTLNLGTTGGRLWMAGLLGIAVVGMVLAFTLGGS